MKKKYNKNYQIHIFKIDDVVTVTISSKNRAVIDPSKIKAQIVAILHENRYKFQTEYNILTNHYSTNELNSMF